MRGLLSQLDMCHILAINHQSLYLVLLISMSAVQASGVGRMERVLDHAIYCKAQDVREQPHWQVVPPTMLAYILNVSLSQLGHEQNVFYLGCDYIVYLKFKPYKPTLHQ